MAAKYCRVVLYTIGVMIVVSSPGLVQASRPACIDNTQTISVTSTACQQLSSSSSESATNTCHLGPFLHQVDPSCDNVEITLQSDIEYTLLAEEGESNGIHTFTKVKNLSIVGNGLGGQRAQINCVVVATGLPSDSSPSSSWGGLFVQGCQLLRLRGLALSGCSYPILNFTANSTSSSFSSSTSASSSTSDADSSQTDTDRVAVYAEFCEAVEMEDAEVSDTNGVAVMIYSVRRVTISGSTFRRNGLRPGEILASSGAVYIQAPEESSFQDTPPDGQHSLPTPPPPQYVIESSTFADNMADPRRSRNVHTTDTFRNADAFQDGRGSGLQLYFQGAARGASVRVHNCTFANNTALFGAGLSLYMQSSTGNNTVRVTGSTFDGNRGLEYSEEDGLESGGGAMQFMLTAFQRPHEQQQRSGNATQFSSSSSGGGHNTLQVRDCTFRNNSAYFGGAVSVIASREPSSRATNRIQFAGCRWEHNRARLGAAIDCVEWTEVQTGSLPRLDLQDNTFAANSVNYYHNKTATIGGSGTIYTDSVPVSLRGSNTFVANTGSGMTTVDALVYFEETSVTNFTNNSAAKGGGISMYGQAKLILSPNIKVVFTNNTAFLNGAAIYYRLGGPRNLMTSQSCFIQYHDMAVHPNNWTNVSMEFDCNRAKMDNSAIFASSILPCTWTGAPYGHGFIVNKTKAIQNAICIITVNQSNSTCHSVHINTDSLWANKTELAHMTAFPGQKLKLNNFVRNELQSESYSVFRGDSLNPSLGHLTGSGSGSQYISQMELKFSGQPHHSFDIKLASPWTLYFEIKSRVTLIPCAPGFDINNEENEEKHICSCTAKTKQMYEGIISCNSSHAEMHPSFWAGYINSTNQLCSDEQVQHDSQCRLYTGYCALGHCNIHRYTTTQYGEGGNEFTVPLPDRPSNLELKGTICGESKRKGILCSKCIRGYAPELNSFSTGCVSCNESLSGWDYVYAGTVWVAVRFVPITIMVVVFLLFDVDILTGSMQCFIFYSQILTYLTALLKYNMPEPLQTLVRVSFMGSDIWRLRFGRYIYEKTRYGAPTVCFHVHNLTLALLEYITAVLPFLIIFSLWFCKGMQEQGYCCRPCNCLLRRIRVGIHRLRSRWTSDSTIVHGLVAFVVFSYTQFLVTSAKLVAPSAVYSRGGGGGEVLHRVKYNGSMAYAHSEHLPYLVVGVAVLGTFTAIPPAVLILVPLLPRTILRLGPERQSRIVRLCDRCFSGSKWQFFLDAFQGGFKPQFSFFSGLFFLYRIVIVVIYVLPATPGTQYFIQTLSVACFLIIHALCQPYRKRIHNLLDTLIYANMLVLLITTSYLWQQTSKSREFPLDHFPYFILCIVNLPQACLMAYALFRLFRATRKLYRLWRLRRVKGRPVCQSSSLENSEMMLFNDSFHARHEYTEGIDIKNADMQS